jgi:EpsD family peptidyl-prolyl cis-trans isomerase
MHMPPLSQFLMGRMTLKKSIVLVIAAVLLATLASCGEKREANQKAAIDDQVKVLATVNGVPITEYDVNTRSRKVVAGGEAHGASPNPNVLQALVREELVYQKAVQLGLDKKPEYRRKLSDVEAQFRAFQRQEMANLYRGYVREKAAVTDSEVREYFEKNAKQLQTKFHVFQIFYKGKYNEIVKDHEDLKKGMPFEKVAARRFAGLPKDIKAPWDLGEMSWNQMPTAWQGIVDRLEPGQVTDIIKGENGRFWVIKLAGKRVDPQITFATEKEKLAEILGQQKADALYKTLLDEINEKAKIVYTK